MIKFFLVVSLLKSFLVYPVFVLFILKAFQLKFRKSDFNDMITKRGNSKLKIRIR